MERLGIDGAAQLVAGPHGFVATQGTNALYSIDGVEFQEAERPPSRDAVPPVTDDGCSSLSSQTFASLDPVAPDRAAGVTRPYATCSSSVQVQPPTHPRTDRRHPTSRIRSQLLPSEQPSQDNWTQAEQSPMNPDRFSLGWLASRSLMYPCHRRFDPSPARRSAGVLERALARVSLRWLLRCWRRHLLRRQKRRG